MRNPAPICDEELLAPQWTLLASPGHALFAQVDAWRFKARRWLIDAGLGLLLVFFFGSVATYGAAAIMDPVSDLTSALGGWIAKTKEPERAPVPLLPHPVDIAGAGEAELQRVVTLDQLEAAIPAYAAAVQAGKPADCYRGGQFSDRWLVPAGQDAYFNCRESKDKSRLWLWGAVQYPGPTSMNGQLVHSLPAKDSFFIVLRKGADKPESYALKRTAQRTLKGATLLNFENVRRAALEDLPELDPGRAVDTTRKVKQ